MESLTQSISNLPDSLDDLAEDSGGLQVGRRITAAAFGRLIEKLPTYSQELRDFLKSDLISDSTHFTTSKDQLKSDLLPLLRHQVTCLSLLLDPSDIKQGPVQKLRMIFKLVLELDQTLNKIHVLFYVQVSDTNAQKKGHTSLDTTPKPDLTLSRYTRLTWMVTSIVEELNRLLSNSRSLFVDFNFPKDHVQEHSPEVASRLNDTLSKKIQEITKYTSFAWKLIDELSDRISQSDCSLLQEELQREVALVDDALTELLNIISFDPDPDESDQHSDYSQTDFEYQQVPLSDDFFKIGTLMVPLIKLSRLFLNKISKTRANKEPTTLLSKMSPDGLSSLLALLVRPGSVSREIDEMVCALDSPSEGTDHGYEHLVEHCVIGPIRKLQECFESSTLVLMPYLDAMSSAEFDDQVDPKKWFKTWNCQFTTAAQKLIDAGTNRT